MQLCIQALVLEGNDDRVGEGFLWFAGSRERVSIVFDEELRAHTREAAPGWTSMLHVQARHLLGKIDSYPHYCPG